MKVNNKAFKKKFQEKTFAHSKNSNEAKNNTYKKPYKSSNNIKNIEKEIFTEATINKASTLKKEGHVKVLYKSKTIEQYDNKPLIKRTGALSPRAPENIKQNKLEEMKVCGISSVNAIFNKRPESIVRLWCTPTQSNKISNILSYLAEKKKTYHLVNNSELDKIAKTIHHEGVCVLVKKAKPMSLRTYISMQQEKDCIIILDNVINPYHIGGIIKSSVCYGCKPIVVDNLKLLESNAVHRIAAGGLEHMYLFEHSNVNDAISLLKNHGYQIIFTCNDKTAVSLQNTKLNKKIAIILTEKLYSVQKTDSDIVVNLTKNSLIEANLSPEVVAGILLENWNKK